MDRDAFADWLGGYFGAWRSNDRAEVEALFSEDAVSSYGPFEEATTDGGRVTLDGILVCDVDGAGCCTLHREWFDRREDPR